MKRGRGSDLKNLSPFDICAGDESELYKKQHQIPF